MNIINIVFAVNANYFPYLKNSIQSIISLNDMYNYKIWVLHDNLSVTEQQVLLKISSGINFINVSCSSIFHDVKRPNWVSNEAFLRLEISRLIPDIDKCIYLDSDTEVKKTLYNLWNTDLKGKTIGGVKCFRTSGINSGVLLIDLAKWRTEKFDEKIKDYVFANIKHIRNGDQYIINKVFHRNILPLDRKYNFQRHTKDKEVVIIHYAVNSKRILDKKLSLNHKDKITSRRRLFRRSRILLP